MIGNRNLGGALGAQPGQVHRLRLLPIDLPGNQIAGRVGRPAGFLVPAEDLKPVSAIVGRQHQLNRYRIFFRQDQGLFDGDVGYL